MSGVKASAVVAMSSIMSLVCRLHSIRHIYYKQNQINKLIIALIHSVLSIAASAFIFFSFWRWYLIIRSAVSYFTDVPAHVDNSGRERAERFGSQFIICGFDCKIFGRVFSSDVDCDATSFSLPIAGRSVEDALTII